MLQISELNILPVIDSLRYALQDKFNIMGYSAAGSP